MPPPGSLEFPDFYHASGLPWNTSGTAIAGLASRVLLTPDYAPASARANFANLWTFGLKQTAVREQPEGSHARRWCGGPPRLLPTDAPAPARAAPALVPTPEIPLLPHRPRQPSRQNFS